MDSLTQIRLTRELVDIDSTTGREAEAGEFLDEDPERSRLRRRRRSRSATAASTSSRCWARPRVVLSTHFDCVPPFFPSRESNGRLYGRGSCDAKGILVAQIAAVENVCGPPVKRALGLLFVVGEERGSEGAKTANTVAPGSQFLINGEPTDNRLATATRGVYRVRLRARGTAAHSSLPELGVSAIDKLMDALVTLRTVAWPSDAVMGTTFYTVGLINGGVAPNVVSPEAEAELMFRTVGDHEMLRSQIESTRRIARVARGRARRARRCGSRRSLDSTRPRLRSRPTSRSSRTGGRRSSSARARSRSPTRTTSTWRSRSCEARRICTARWSKGCCLSRQLGAGHSALEPAPSTSTSTQHRSRQICSCPCPDTAPVLGGAHR